MRFAPCGARRTADVKDPLLHTHSVGVSPCVYNTYNDMSLTHLKEVGLYLIKTHRETRHLAFGSMTSQA